MFALVGMNRKELCFRADVAPWLGVQAMSLAGSSWFRSLLLVSQLSEWHLQATLSDLDSYSGEQFDLNLLML